MDKALIKNGSINTPVMSASLSSDYTRLENDLNKLLHLIEELVGIRQRDDLAKLIKEKIKPILDFDDAVIILVDKYKKRARHFLNIATDERKSHPFYMQTGLPAFVILLPLWQVIPFFRRMLQEILSYSPPRFLQKTTIWNPG